MREPPYSEIIDPSTLLTGELVLRAPEGLVETAQLQDGSTVTLWREPPARLRLRVDTAQGFVELVRGGGTSYDDLVELVLDADERVVAPGLRAWALEARWRHWRLESKPQ